MTKEVERLQQDNWKKWGSYLSDRQWGTVREDYSNYGEAWEYFSHDQGYKLLDNISNSSLFLSLRLCPEHRSG